MAICKCQLHSRLKSALCCLCEMRNMRGVVFFPIFFFFLGRRRSVFRMCFRAAGLGWALLAALHLSEYTSDAAVGEGFYLESRFNTQQSTPKIDSTFEMPHTPVRCGFKVQNGIATPPCLGWIKKKGNKHPVLPFPATLCFYFCRNWCRQCLVSPQREFFFPVLLFSPPCCVVTSEELPGKKHSLSAGGAASSQTRPFSYYFLSAADTRSKTDVYQEKWEKGGRIGQVEGGSEKRGGWWVVFGWGGGWLLEPGRGQRVPVGRNSGKHP